MKESKPRKRSKRTMRRLFVVLRRHWFSQPGALLFHLEAALYARHLR
jgi:hypothetical protein